MKFFIFLLIFKILFIFINTNHTNSTFSTKTETRCLDPCKVCQSSIYTLKVNSKIDCFSTECPEVCSSLRNEFFTQTNMQLTFFRNNQLNVCETCFRLSMCHMNDCREEIFLIHQAISSILDKTQIFHKITEDKSIMEQVNRLANDFSFNFNLIFTNGKRLMSEVKNFINLYYYSETLKKIYFNFYEKITQEKYELNQEMISDPNSEIFEEFLRRNENLDLLLQNYLMQMNNLATFYNSNLIQLKPTLTHEGIYGTLALSEESIAITKFLEFNVQMKNLIEEIFNFTEYINYGIQNNLIKIKNVKKSFFGKNFRRLNINNEEPTFVIENTIDKKKIIPKKVFITKKKEKHGSNTKNRSYPKERENKISKIPRDLFQSTLVIPEENQKKLSEQTLEDLKFPSEIRIYNNHTEIKPPSTENDKLKQKFDEIDIRLNMLNKNFKNLTEEIKSPGFLFDPIEDLDTIQDRRQILTRNLRDSSFIDDFTVKRERIMNKNILKKIVQEEIEEEQKRKEKEEEEKRFRKLLKKTYNLLVNFQKDGLITKNLNLSGIPQNNQISILNETRTNFDQSSITNLKLLNDTLENNNIIINPNVISNKNNDTNQSDFNQVDDDNLVDKMDFDKLQKLLNNNTKTDESKSNNDTISDRTNESVFQNFFIEKKINKLDKDLNNLRHNLYHNILG